MSTRNSRLLSLVFLALGAGVTGCDRPAPAAPEAAAPATAASATLPNPRPGLWRTRTTTTDSPPEDSQECVEKDETPLSTFGAPDAGACKRNIVRAVPGGYEIDISCASNSIGMAMKGSVRGDFQTTMTMDIELGLGAEDAPLETTRIRMESHYVGPCPAE